MDGWTPVATSDATSGDSVSTERMYEKNLPSHRSHSHAPGSRRSPTTPPRTPDTWRVVGRRRTSSPAHPCSRRCVGRRGRRRRRARDRESTGDCSEAGSLVSSYDCGRRDLVRRLRRLRRRRRPSVSHRTFTFRSIVRLARHSLGTHRSLCARARREGRDSRMNGRCDKCPRASSRPRVHRRRRARVRDARDARDADRPPPTSTRRRTTTRRRVDFSFPRGRVGTGRAIDPRWLPRRMVGVRVRTSGVWYVLEVCLSP